MSIDSLAFEDISVGQRFVTAELRIGQEDIIAFAKQFDPQPFHTDPAAAPDTPFRRLVASGWHTAAVTMRLLVESEMRPLGGIIGRAIDQLEWPRPVLPGDVLHCEAEVIEARRSRSKPRQGLVKLRVETLNQNGEAVQIFSPLIVVPARTEG